MAADDGPHVEQMIQAALDYIKGYREERDQGIGHDCLVCPLKAVIKDLEGLWWCLKHYAG